MKKIICCVLIPVLLMTGCSSTLYPLTEPGRAEVNDKAGDKGGTIVLRITEEEIEAESILLKQDSLYWTVKAEDMPGYRRQQVPIPVDLISEIKITNRLSGMLVWSAVGFLPLLLILANKEDDELGYAFSMIGTVLFVTMGIIGYINGIDDHYAITDPKQWSEFAAVGRAVSTGRKDLIRTELDKIIDSSEDEKKVTTAIFLKMQYELDEPAALYETLKSRFPDHIYTTLAERLLEEKYGIRPVKQ